MRKNYYKRRLESRRKSTKKNFASCLKIGTGIGLIIMMSAMFIFCYDLLTQCSCFKARSIKVTGAERLIPARILKVAGIEKNMNVLLLNLNLARKRLIAHPWIEKAAVMRELPDGIVVKVTEYKPLAVLDLERRYLISDKGIIFKVVNKSDHENLPIVKGLGFADINVSDSPGSIPFHAVMEVLRLGRDSESPIPNRLIKRIDVDREIGITVFLSSGEGERFRKIKLGYNRFSHKYKKFDKILEYFKTRQRTKDLDEIDLINPDRIVVKPLGIKPHIRDRKEV